MKRSCTEIGNNEPSNLARPVRNFLNEPVAIRETLLRQFQRDSDFSPVISRTWPRRTVKFSSRSRRPAGLERIDELLSWMIKNPGAVSGSFGTLRSTNVSRARGRTETFWRSEEPRVHFEISKIVRRAEEVYDVDESCLQEKLIYIIFHLH